MDPESLFVTNGVSGALGLVCSLFAGRGDTVIVENPSYFLALSIFRDFGMNIVPCDLDSNGLDTVKLEAMLRANPSLRPKFVYTIPAFQNPTGYILSAERKAHLVRLAAAFDFVILADEVYQLLGFDGVPPPPAPMCYFDTPEVAGPGAGKVISIGSFAKILSPGLRLGWMQFSPSAMPLFKKIYNCGQLDSSGAMNPVVSGIVHTAIDTGMQAEHLADVRAELTKRATILGDALRKSLPPGATFIQPSGGYFIWIKLPTGMNGAHLLDHCIANFKNRFHPGERFGSGLENYIRLSFSYYNADDLAIGAQRLGDAMRSLMEKGLAPAVIAQPALAVTGPAVAVHGSTGRLGSLIAGLAGKGGEAASGAPATLTGSIARDSGIPAGTQVVIDVTLPTGTAALLEKLNAHAAAGNKALPLIIGTTGDLPMDAIRAYAAKAPVAISANFSAGIPLVLSMLESCKTGLPSGWTAEVTEIHHTAKKDAPSGTAKRLVAGLAANNVKGLDASQPVPAHALRLGDTVGVHTVFLAGPGERVEITHTATRREVFAIGALRLAAWVATQQPGLYIK